jgi:TRAP-type C4-dicarboxylate transport system permease small subunit
MLVLSILQMLVRNLFDIGFPEIDIINRHLLVVSGMMGAVLATSLFRHIKIDALAAIMSDETLALFKCPLAMFSALICLAMFYFSVIFCMDEWQYAPPNERWILPFTLIYPVGFALLSIHFLFFCRPIIK